MLANREVGENWTIQNDSRILTYRADVETMVQYVVCCLDIKALLHLSKWADADIAR